MESCSHCGYHVPVTHSRSSGSVRWAALLHQRCLARWLYHGRRTCRATERRQAANYLGGRQTSPWRAQRGPPSDCGRGEHGSCRGQTSAQQAARSVRTSDWETGAARRSTAHCLLYYRTHTADCIPGSGFDRRRCAERALRRWGASRGRWGSMGGGPTRARSPRRPSGS
jgi:hypothetical protein